MAAAPPRLLTWLFDLLFPPRCLGCGRHGALLCPPCLEEAPRLAARWHPPELGSALAGWTAPFSFDGVIRQAVHALKYRGTRAVAPLLAEEMARHLEAIPQEVDWVVPVPLHPQRLRERGFNQAALLAQPLTETFDLPLAQHLARLRSTPPQVRMASAVRRQENVHGAFAWVGPSLAGGAILLVDDVSTTGATLNAAAEALRGGGAAVVWGLVLAKELGP